MTLKKNTASGTSQDNVVAYVAGVVVVVLAIIFSITWYYVRESDKNRADVAYAKVGPLNIQTRGYAIRASLAVQTRTGETGWIKDNKKTLDNAFQKVLAETDPKSLLGQSGKQALQEALKEASNAALHTENVQAVLLTDLVLTQEN